MAPCAYINQVKALFTLDGCHLVTYKIIRVQKQDMPVDEMA